MLKKFLKQFQEMRKYNKKVYSSSKADAIAIITNRLKQNEIPYIVDNIKVSPEAAPLFIVKVKSEDLEKANNIVRDSN